MNVGRGRGSYDEIERRGLSVITNSVTVYHSSEKESRQLEEKEWGHFYSAESKITLLTSNDNTLKDQLVRFSIFTCLEILYSVTISNHL